MTKEMWSVQEVIKKRVNYEADVEWSKSPNLKTPKHKLGPVLKNNTAWHVLITNTVRLANELRP